ncbi:MAG: hypothetical protein ACLSB9_00775 [Hydrogeniiclostridium mannosilyticum]
MKVARDEAEKKKELQDLKVIEQQESYRIEAGALLYRLDMKCEENIAGISVLWNKEKHVTHGSVAE